MTTFYFEAPLLIEPKGVLKVTGMAKPNRSFDLYHKPPMFLRGVLGSAGNIDIDRPHRVAQKPPMFLRGVVGIQGDISNDVSAPVAQCQLDFVQTWGPVPAPASAFDLDQVRIDVAGTLRA